MGVVDGFKGAGLFAQISSILLTISAMFAWIAYTCTGWADAGKGSRHYGLWRACQFTPATPISASVSDCNQLDGSPLDWLAATQAFVTFGFFGINIALFLTVLYMFVPSCTKHGEVGMATAIVCIVTGILYLFGVIIFGAKFNDDFRETIAVTVEIIYINLTLGYCFGLSIVALLFEIAAGVLMFLDSKKSVTPI